MGVFLIACQHLQLLSPVISIMGEASFLTLLEGAYLSIIGVSEGSPRSLRMV